jgi:hypothetical protein
MSGMAASSAVMIELRSRPSASTRATSAFRFACCVATETGLPSTSRALGSKPGRSDVSTFVA